ncbi:MAG: DUF6538 domain-containing protein [Planctomycetota bacterium]
MPLSHYVQRRRSGYYYRQRVPKLRQQQLGKHEIVVSLRTMCPKAAWYRAAQLYVSVNEILDTPGSMSQHHLTHQLAAQIAERWKRRALNEDFDQRLAGQPTRTDSDVTRDLQSTLEDLQRVRLEPHKGLIDTVISEHRLGLASESEDWRRLGYYLVKASSEFLHEVQKRSDPDHLAPMSYIPPEQGEQDTVVSGTWLKLSEAIDRWEQEGGRRALTVKEWRYRIKRFIELKGDRYVHQITTDDIRDFKDAYKQMPAKLPQKDRQRSLPQIIERYADCDVDRLKPNSINNGLSALSSVLSWCVENRYLKENVALGIRVPRPKKGVRRRLPYDANDLAAIFEQSPIYQLGQRPHGCGGEASYWIPVMALYTGARLEEIAQLTIDDVRREAGWLYLDINDEGEKKFLKNASSKRRVPVHPRMIELGFDRFLKLFGQQGHEDLFPNVQSATGKRTAAFSKWINRHLRIECGIRDPRKVFHSFRHTFKDACREAGIARDLHNALTGHATGGVDQEYGLGFSIKTLGHAIGSIHYEGLSIPAWRHRR